MKLPAIRINPLGMLTVTFCLIFFIFLYASGFFGRNESHKSTVNLKHLLAVGISVAETGGTKIKEVRFSTDLKESSKGKTREGANDPLTAGDLLSHRVMAHGILKAFPKLKVVSEEHEDKNMQSDDLNLPAWYLDSVNKISENVEVPLHDIVVWIDPLDATQEYTENLLEYVTTMVCIAVKGKPVIGIIHRPFQNSTVWAWVNHGISDLNFAAKSKHYDSSKPPSIIVSRSHAGKVEEVAKAAFGPEVKVISAGGSGYKSLQVALGKADAYIHVTLIKKWDICAGNALLSALGGHMTTLDGNDIDYSDPTDVQNSKGLIATLHDHQKFLDKLSNLKN